MCLKGCELVADVSVWARKFGINLRVPSADGMAEVCLRCGDEASYARWLSGCKLASRDGSVSAQAVSNEVGSILGLLRHGGDVAEGGQASDLVTLRMLKKYGVKAVRDFVE
jgi:kindlin 3